MKQKLRCGIWRLVIEIVKLKNSDWVRCSVISKMFKITYSALLSCLITQLCIESFKGQKQMRCSTDLSI